MTTRTVAEILEWLHSNTENCLSTYSGSVFGPSYGWVSCEVGFGTKRKKLGFDVQESQALQGDFNTALVTLYSEALELKIGESKDRMVFAEQERDALRQQLTATTNSLTNAQEALKSAGIEADTVQAGVMELALMRDKMAAVARDFASTIAWADDVGALSMTELKRYDLDGQCEEAISRAKLDIIDAADAYLNAVRAEGLDMAAAEIDRWVGCGSLAREIRQKSIHIRAGNAGKEASHD